MLKRIFITAFALFVCFLTVDAQDYSRYYRFYDEAVKLMNAGKLADAKAKFINIKKILSQGGIPSDNDLDQKIRECTIITFSPSGLEFESTEQTASVTVSVNAQSYSASCNSKWCHVAKKQNIITVTCDENTVATSRNATVVVSADGKSKSFSVFQQGGELEFEVEPRSVSFPNVMDSAIVTVTTNVGAWQVDSAPDWILVDVDEREVRLVCKTNEEAQPRTADVMVCVDDDCIPVSVTQSGADTILMVYPDRLVLPCDLSDGYFVVNTNLVQLEKHDSDDWIFSAINNDTVRVSVFPNESIFSRIGEVRIGAGDKTQTVTIAQRPRASDPPVLASEIGASGDGNSDSFYVKSIPSDLNVTIKDDFGGVRVECTPFEMPVDFGHYTLESGFQHVELLANKSQDVVFTPGSRFASLTWSPGTAVGMMSGFIGIKSWGAYSHFQANMPFVSDLKGIEGGLAGYNFTVGPVFRPNSFPYAGAYAGLGIGCYMLEPHIGFDYEAGVMGFYKNLMLSLGFHTTRLSSTLQNTSFVMGIGGYLKRYYDPDFGFCSSDSRRWVSLNYVFRPSENGKGFMIGDMGQKKLRTYLKVLYMTPGMNSDSLPIRNIEGAFGFVFTPVDGLIDLCAGVSGGLDITPYEYPKVPDFDKRSLGVGLELGTILNVWRFPITIILHESDVFGERRLVVDFGIGFHLGKFGKSNCSYL